jgi:hypothetical protein
VLTYVICAIRLPAKFWCVADAGEGGGSRAGVPKRLDTVALLWVTVTLDTAVILWATPQLPSRASKQKATLNCFGKLLREVKLQVCQHAIGPAHLHPLA